MTAGAIRAAISDIVEQLLIFKMNEHNFKTNNIFKAIPRSIPKDG